MEKIKTFHEFLELMKTAEFGQAIVLDGQDAENPIYRFVCIQQDSVILYNTETKGITSFSEPVTESVDKESFWKRLFG